MPVLYSLAACRMGTVFWPRYATAWLCRRLCLTYLGPVTSFRSPPRERTFSLGLVSAGSRLLGTTCWDISKREGRKERWCKWKRCDPVTRLKSPLRGSGVRLGSIVRLLPYEPGSQGFSTAWTRLRHVLYHMGSRYVGGLVTAWTGLRHVLYHIYILGPAGPQFRPYL